MASVYLARHRVHGGFCAVKVLADHLAKQPPLVRSFLTEARASASLDEHPNIVNIVDIDEHAGLYYMIMKYVEGEDLSSYLQRKKGALTWKQAAYVAAETAEALAWSHDRGVIHRDLKPSNIRLNRRGGITVMDFGIAKVGQTPSSFTEMGTRAGTPHYMAPEQIRGDRVDHRSDLYGLGVILYQMATGRRPFSGSNPAAIWQAHLNEEPTPPQEIEPSIPDPLNHIILNLLVKDVDRRYDTAARVARHLRTLGLEGVKATLDPIDQLDLDYLRTQEVRERRLQSTPVQAEPAPEDMSETGQSPSGAIEDLESSPTITPAETPEAGAAALGGVTFAAAEDTFPAPPLSDVPPVAAAPKPIAVAEVHEPAPVRREWTPIPTPAGPVVEPLPTPVPVKPPPAATTVRRPAVRAENQTAARPPRPPDDPSGPRPTVQSSGAIPALPTPARQTTPRAPSAEPFMARREGANRKPLVFGAALVSAAAITGFLLLRPGDSLPPPEPVVEQVQPAEQAPPPPAEVEPAILETPVAEQSPPPVEKPVEGTPAPAPPRKPAPPKLGAVYFRSEPNGASIQVDNRPDWSCQTPCWLEGMSAGQHTVTARLEDHRVAISRFEVKPGARAPFDIRLEADVISAMIASTPPGADIYIDGQKQADKTNARIPLKPGTYQIRVVMPGVAEGETILVVSESQMPYANFVLEAK
jgi:serine/threonine protein kinase